MRMNIVLLLCALSCGGCSPVQPWEKEFLAKPVMAFDADPLEAQFRRHVYQSKEASSGGYTVGVGSCGCYLREQTARQKFRFFCDLRPTTNPPMLTEAPLP